MQQIIVILIGIIVLGYTCYKIYKTIKSKSTSDVTCDGCSNCAPIDKKVKPKK